MMMRKYKALLKQGWEFTDNAFDGLGLGDTAGLQTKAYLRAAILSQIAALEITQAEAARRVGIRQPKLSNLVNDTGTGFSSEKLIEYATKLGLDVTIGIAPARFDVGRLLTRAGVARKASNKKSPRRKKARGKVSRHKTKRAA